MCMGVDRVVTEDHFSSHCLLIQSDPLDQSMNCMLCCHVNGSDSVIFHSLSQQFSHDSDIALHSSSSSYPNTYSLTW